MKILEKFLPTRVEVVEKEKLGNPPTKEDRAHLASLLLHPGFRVLMDSFKNEQAKLETVMKTQRFENIRDFDAVQLGLYWLGYAERKCKAAAGEIQDSRRVASDQELADFQSAHSAIQLVGQQ